MGLIFNFFMRIIKFSIKISLYLVILSTIIVLIPNLPPYTKFTSIEVAPTQSRQGPLAPNDALNNAEMKFKGKLIGPEAFQVSNGDLYTSLATGEIVKISPAGHITFVTKVGQPCTGLSKEHICGRPLGFEIDDKGETLYLADAYHGIWRVNLKTDKKQLLVSPRVQIGNRQPKLFNAIALAKSGDFYWSDSTSDFYLHDGAMSVLADPSGRVFYYNAAKNESKVLVDDLWFANGLALSPNNEFLVIAETAKYRLLKHYITGPKKGTTEVFIDGIPGSPDNVRALPDGSGILVGLYTVFDEQHPLLTRSMSNTPLVRKFLARLQRLIEIPFEYLNNIYPHVVFEEIVYRIGHFKMVSGLIPPYSGLLHADWNGNILATYFNTDRTLPCISEAIVFNDKLYTGSPHTDFIGAVPIPPLLKKGYESVKEDAKPQKAKPVEQVKATVEEKPKMEKPKAEPKLKVEQKAKVEKKPEVKDKVEQKAKVEDKPKAQQQPKVEPKPKVESKPKVEEKTTTQPTKPTTPPPKPTTPPPKPTTPPPKPTTPPPKATTPPPKPTTPPPKPTTPPPKPTTAPPKPTTPPPKPTAAPPKSTKSPTTPETTKKTQTQEPTRAPTPKPDVKTTLPPKPASTTPPPPKETNKQPPKSAPGKSKEQIPIKEEIPSDTAMPTKETLKVIKKGGVPTEIPVPSQ